MDDELKEELDDALCDWLNSRIEELVKYAIIGH